VATEPVADAPITVGRAVSARRIVAAAAMIAVVTVVARLFGFVRTLVFAGAVGTTDLGDIYQTANTIPNIIFEVVAGGALAVIVVPLLAGAVAAGDTREVARISSALLTWTVALLLPLALALALFASPVVALLAGDAGALQVAIGARMLRVFAIQLPLYGAGVVLAGVLHAHRRFFWPVIAPLLSSVVVIGAYLAFAAVDGPGTDVAQVSRAGELILSIGTTLGVAALAGCLLIPVATLRLHLRPSLALAGEIRRRAVALAGAAVATVAAQQVATAAFIRLANGGAEGTVVLFVLTQAVFLVPWAALAVALSTPAFPMLAEAAATGDRTGFDDILSRTARGVLLAAGLGIAGLIGLAVPLGRLLSAVTAGHPPAGVITAAILAFAPGLLGYSLFALLNRALNAAGEARAAAGGAVIGWAATVLAAVALAAGAPSIGLADAPRVVVLAAANSVGMTVLGGALLFTVSRRRGRPALRGFVRTLLVSLAGAGLAGAAGWGVGLAVARFTPGVTGSLGAGMLAGVVVAAAYTVVAIAFDRGDVRPVLRGALARVGRRPGEE
jgi:putative peptidoglycan lipid II flippase